MADPAGSLTVFAGQGQPNPRHVMRYDALTLSFLCCTVWNSSGDDIGGDDAIAMTMEHDDQWRTGGVWDFQTPPPQNSEGPTNKRAKLNPIVKTVKKNCWI